MEQFILLIMVTIQLILAYIVNNKNNYKIQLSLMWLVIILLSFLVEKS